MSQKCPVGDRGVATRTALSVSSKTNARMAVFAAQRVDVVRRGEEGGFPCLCAFRLALLFLPSSGSSPHLSSAVS